MSPQPQDEDAHAPPRLRWRRNLTGSRVLVTGASSGVGRAVAFELARRGARVLATGLSSSSAPLVVAASYALAGLPEGELLLATAAVAVVTMDVLAAAIGLGTRWQFPAGALSTPPSAAQSTPPMVVQR